MLGYLPSTYYGQYPQAITQTAPSTTLQGLRLFVDWNGDGSFSGAYDDVSADMLAVQCRRGRDYASQLTGRSSAGTLRATLLNNLGKYSRFNSSSPLFGSLLPGRKVKLVASTPISQTLWTGFLDDLQPQAGDLPMAELSASGGFRILADQANQINAGPHSGFSTGLIIHAILDAAGWPTAARSIQPGVVVCGDWFVQEQIALQALQEMEETEIGFVYEGLDHDVVFESRYWRLLASAASQATFTDAAGGSLPYVEVQQSDALREIFNRITATVQAYTTQALGVLWTLNGTPFALSPGTSVTYIASVNAGFVDPWTTPVVGTDITQTGVSNSDIGVSVVKGATQMTITVTNNHATLPTTITLFQARGVLVSPDDPYQVSSEDTTSQGLYGPRTYPLPSPWYQNGAYAQAAVDYFITLKKDPHPVLRFSLPAPVSVSMFDQAVTRRLSERITLVATSFLNYLGINQDFFIEAIEHVWSPEGGLLTTWDVSPADAVADYWMLDVDELGVGTVLAY